MISVEEYHRLKRRDRQVLAAWEFSPEQLDATRRAEPPAEAALGAHGNGPSCAQFNGPSKCADTSGGAFFGGRPEAPEHREARAAHLFIDGMAAPRARPR
jgi:hypothetical protein